MAPAFLQYNPLRIRSFVFRLPLCTRVLAIVITVLWKATFFVPWLQHFCALVPNQVKITSSMVPGVILEPEHC